MKAFKLFMSDPDRMPEMVIDCEYKGDLDPHLSGIPVDITPCIEQMKRYYHKVSNDYFKDNIITTVWLKKGCTPPQIMQDIICKIEEK